MDNIGYKSSKYNFGDMLLFIYIAALCFLNYTIGYMIPMLILCIVTFFFIIKKNKFVINSYILYQLFLITFCYSYVLLKISVSNEDTLSSVCTLIQNLMVNTIIINYVYLNKKNYVIKFIEKIFSWFIPISIFLSIFILFYTQGNGEYGRLGHGILKPFSKTEHYTSTEIALVAFYGISSIIYFYLKHKNKKILYFMPLLLLIIILSGSRKAFIMLLVMSLLFYLDFNTSKKDIIKRIVKSIVIFVIIFLCIIAIIKVPFLYEKVGYRFTGLADGTESSGNSRKIMMQTAIDLIKEKPLFGYGLNTFKTFDGSFGTWAHNNYLELWVSIGIVGMSIYYIYILYLIINLYKYSEDNKINKLMLYYLIIFVICDFIGVTYKSRMIQFFYLIASILVNENKKRR